MDMIWNGLMGLYCHLALMLILSTALSAGSCKNKAASKNIDTLLEKKQQTADAISTPKKMDQSGNKTSDVNPTDKSLQDHLEQTDPVDAPPHFTLENITIEAGRSQATTLTVVNRAEGYIIKSISVTKNTTTRYTNQFGLDGLTNQPIPPSGLPFTLTAHQSLKADQYLLKIKVGKTGAGSQKTEQLVQSTITITNGNGNKIKTEEESAKIRQITQPSSDEKVKQEDGQNDNVKEEDDQNETAMSPTIQHPIENVTDTSLKQPIKQVEGSPVICSFDKEGVESSNIAMVSCKIGESIMIPYHIEGHQADYKIKSIQIIKQGGQHSTNKKLFGLADYPGSLFQKQIKLSPTIQTAGSYQLIIKIQKGRGDPLLISKCNIAVMP